MKNWQSLAHTKWYCKYHVVIVPKYRQKVFYSKRREKIGEILRELCRQKDLEIVEGHAMPDHIHMCVSIPPKFSVAMSIGFLKGKSAIRIHRELLGRRRGFTNLHFWSRGYCVSIVGLDEETLRAYTQNQDRLDGDSQGELYLGDDDRK